MEINFKEENLYFLKQEDCKYGSDTDSMITDINELNKFTDSGIIFSNDLTIGEIKEKLESIINRKIPLGNSSEDAMIEWNLTEKELLEKSYDEITLHFDVAVFKDVYIQSGNEIINEIEILKM
jgi:hypothetical protein